MGVNPQPVVEMNTNDFAYFDWFNKTYNPKGKTPYKQLPESVKDQVTLRYKKTPDALDAFIGAYNCENKQDNCIKVNSNSVTPTEILSVSASETTSIDPDDASETSDVVGNRESVAFIKKKFSNIDPKVLDSIDKWDGKLDGSITPDGAQAYLNDLRETSGSYSKEAYAAKLLTMWTRYVTYPILNYGFLHSAHVFTGHAINLDRHEYGFSDRFTVLETQPFGYRLNWTKFNNFLKTPWGVVNPGIDVGLLYSVWNGQEVPSNSEETNVVKQHHRGGVRATVKLEGKLGAPIDGFGTIGIVGALAVSADIQIGMSRGDVNMYGAITAYGRLGIGWEFNKPGTGQRYYVTLYTDLIKVGLNPDTNYWAGPLNPNIEVSYAFF